MQGDDSLDKLSFDSFHSRRGDDAAPLGIGYSLLESGGESFGCNAETHFKRVFKISFPAEQLFFKISEPAVFEHAALDAFVRRPFLNRA